MFDDHPHDKHPNDCAFTLVMHALGLSNHSVWSRISREVFLADRRSVKKPLHLANLVKHCNRFVGDDEVQQMVQFALIEGYRAWLERHDGCDPVVPAYWRTIPGQGHEVFPDGNWPVDEVWMRECPTLDERVAYAVIYREGEGRFPGIKNAKLVVCDDDQLSQNPVTLLDDRKLLIGEGHWFRDCFDDHGKITDCVLTAVVETLGLEGPVWESLHKEVLSADRRMYRDYVGFLTKYPMHVASIVEYLCDCDGDFAEGFVELVMLEGYLKVQQSYQEALGVVKTSATKELVHHGKANRDFVLVSIRGCDNEDFSKAARTAKSKGGCEAALVVQMNSQGQVYISPNKYLGTHDVSYLVARLRAREGQLQPFRGEKIRSLAEMKADGIYRGWYHQRAAGSIYNGSVTTPWVPPTHIPFETIVEFCKEHLQKCPVCPEGSGNRRRNA